MKNTTHQWLLILFIFFSFGGCSQRKDPVKKASEVNEEKADHDQINEPAADFIVSVADARMMDIYEGKLAAEKGTSSSIRAYGKLMVTDQTMLLNAVRSLAVKKNITLPEGISNKKENGRDNLAEKSGKDFDKTFAKMMAIDHKRDVKLFKQAIDFEDFEVSQFAKKYLPTIQTHLDQINTICEKQ